MFFKILNLIKLLIDNKAPKFELISINEKDKEIYAIFKNILTGKTYQYSLNKILYKKNILQQFSPQDACKIGYAKGKFLSYKERHLNE